MNSSPIVLIVWHGALYPSYRKPFWILQEKFGWQVHLLTVRSWRKALPRKVKFQPVGNEPITVHRATAFLKSHGALFFQPALPFLLHKISPDIVYVIEEPFSLAAWMSVYECKRRVPGLPVVLYSYQDIYKRYPLPFRWMENFVLRNADRLLVSNTHGGEVWTRKGYERLWDVLPHPVNLERFQYKEPRYGGGLFTLGYAGRLADEKGLDTLLWAMSELNEDVRLRLAGDGPARFRLEKLAKELGVYERVGFTGMVSHEMLDGFYHECDAVILPSKTRKNWQEQFGRMLTEAMACGTPVIGSDCGAIPEVIGGAGMIFPEGNVEALANKIQMLQHDVRLQRALSFQGRVRAEREFSAERVAKKLDQHFREVLWEPA